MKPSKKNLAVKRSGFGKPSYIVGIGGSAGGLEAFEQFFAAMPVNANLAFVLVPHLDPTTKGFMPELLQRATKMKVFQAEDGMRVRANCVYVIPPNKDIGILHGSLQLLAPSAPRGMRLPIDFFFKHLAEDQKDKAVGVVLSGMGSDGTIGLRAIKEKLGMTMVQDPQTAKFDAMPRSAIEAGSADYVCPAQELPLKLVRFVCHVDAPKSEDVLKGDSPGALQKAFLLLREHTGHDFSFYKRSTVFRRIERRMSVHQISRMSHYVRYMQENPLEIEFLFKEMLIGVTNFFRDPACWDVLRNDALPRLLKLRDKSWVFRIWIAACSTGEEAYSMAIAFREALNSAKGKSACKIQVFATDIDKDAIERARAGTFPASIASEVTPDLLSRYFTRDDGGYRVKKVIREMVVFAPQNLIMDPPFTKLDLVCCRNVLIYLNSDLQRKLIPMFHYALNPGGMLFLGTSETIGSFGDLFETVDSKSKLFLRRDTTAVVRSMGEMPSALALPGKPGAVPKSRMHIEASVPDLVQKLLISQYAPASVLINEQGDVVYIHGRTGKFLEPTAGKASMNVFFMAREGLRVELNNAVRKAVRSRAVVLLSELQVKTNGGFETVNVKVSPCVENDALNRLILIVFEIVKPTKFPARVKVLSESRIGAVRNLEKELQNTKETLQSTIEEMETSQEELRSTNEELQSTNEELQSSNEELTTSKEEMQSLNEELITVNTEMESKVEDLSRANNDMKNLLDSIDLATIFLDNELNVKRFTPQATKVINLIPGDVGRPNEHIVSKLKYDGLAADIQEVMRTLVFKEMPVETKLGAWFHMRIMPYRTLDNVIDGTAITFSDISSAKTLEKSLRAERVDGQRAGRACDRLVEQLQEAVIVLEKDGKIAAVSDGFCRVFGHERATLQKHSSIFEIDNKQWAIPKIRDMLKSVFQDNAEVRDYRVQLQSTKHKAQNLFLNAFQDVDGSTRRIVMIVSIRGEATS